MTIVSYRNRFLCFTFMRYFYCYFVKKEIGFKNEREKIGFYFIGLGEILSLLPSYPFKGSKFHVVLFQNVFVSFVCF